MPAMYVDFHRNDTSNFCLQGTYSSYIRYPTTRHDLVFAKDPHHHPRLSPVRDHRGRSMIPRSLGVESVEARSGGGGGGGVCRSTRQLVESRPDTHISQRRKPDTHTSQRRRLTYIWTQNTQPAPSPGSRQHAKEERKQALLYVQATAQIQNLGDSVSQRIVRQRRYSTEEWRGGASAGRFLESRRLPIVYPQNPQFELRGIFQNLT
ncbi:hypothetical protein BZA05DRAFT_181657 [Tricharina praecox]|uniref:uncharacterized protein n=1 Tax=Tricharina praecox TaxID=43433 RepID=UPI00221ECDF9|nr:uncharacterized protein BZA05DRAFT_181657 [Tricharina praecox]KAI5843570.1 hypothetical protein BZA05DRAFT_181657 [Tricharina praecox]